MDRPLVSAITPCYHMGRYLPLFIEWLPRQTFFEHLEIVLDHNEPTAEEVSLVRAFQTRYPGRIRHLIQPKVDPIGISMNRCIREASGELLTIWNVDDLRIENSIERQTRMLLDHPEYGVVHGAFHIVRSIGITEGPLSNHRTYPEEELTRSMMLGPFYMFRRSLNLSAGFFDEQLRSGADFDLAIRLALHARVAHLQEPIGYYLNEGQGASTRPDSLQMLERTVIELRYGIYDKVTYSLAARAARYNIPFLQLGSSWLPVKQFIPDYDAWMEIRYKNWHTLGLEQFSRQEMRRKSLWRRGARHLKNKAMTTVSRHRSS